MVRPVESPRVTMLVALRPDTARRETLIGSLKPPLRGSATWTLNDEPGATTPDPTEALSEKSGIARNAPIHTAFSWNLSGSVLVFQSSVPTASRAMRTWAGVARGYICLY